MPTQAASNLAKAQRWLVPLIVVLTFLYFVGAVAMLYWQWLKDRPPDSVLIVQADQALAGAEVVVEGGLLLEAHRHTLRSEDGYVIPFYVNRGTYTVRILHAGRAREFPDVLVGKNQATRLDLRSANVAEWATTAPAVPSETYAPTTLP
jgi:hypothetical protein